MTAESPQPITDLPIFFEGRLLNTIRVPFTQEELDIIGGLKAIQEGWGKESARGSGWIRELALSPLIPWGYSLADRQYALDTMRAGIGTIRKALEKEAVSEQVQQITADLRTVEEGLLQFVPDMRLENPSGETK